MLDDTCESAGVFDSPRVDPLVARVDAIRDKSLGTCADGPRNLSHGESRATCAACGFIHSRMDTRAIGRFSPEGATRYRSTLVPDASIRATRSEAIADTCAWRVAFMEEADDE